MLGACSLVIRLINGEAEYGLIGIAYIFVFGPVGLFHWYAAKGAKMGARWGRNMSRGFAALVMLGFPVGTVLGYYIFKFTSDANWESLCRMKGEG